MTISNFLNKKKIFISFQYVLIKRTLCKVEMKKLILVKRLFFSNSLTSPFNTASTIVSPLYAYNPLK